MTDSNALWAGADCIEAGGDTDRRVGKRPGERSLRAGVGSRSAAALSWRVFARHFAEMVVVMLVGMGVLEGLAALAFAAAGSSLSAQPGAVRVLLMAGSMTAPMVFWMRHRRHTARHSVEMAASMAVPSVVAAALAAAGVLGVGATLAVQHGVMVPAMLGVMLWRYDEYARPHATSAPPAAETAWQGRPEPPGL
jgi:hypothetical protein